MTKKEKLLRKVKALERKAERLLEIHRKQESGKPLSKKDLQLLRSR